MIDLHTHTQHSDGSASVSELVAFAKDCGIDTLSITDHDSVGAYSEDIHFDGTLIKGVELTALYNGGIVEVLGYRIDTDKMSQIIKDNIKPFIDTIIDQSRIYLPALIAYGVKFSEEFIETCKNEPEKIFTDRMAYSQGVYLREMRKYKENVKFFKDEQEFYNISIAEFTRFFLYNPESTLYVDLSPLIISAKTATDYIHQCGGIAFLAHPFVYSSSVTDNLDKALADIGFDGVECRYASFTKEQTEFLESFCKKHDLLMSGGSDFHGLDVKPNNALGCINTEKDYIKW